MVDVGYFINGRHGVIRNCEIHNYSDTMKYIRFKKGNDIYVMQYKDIEYIIPHEEETIREEVVENYIKDEFKSITNAEKFKEVFGFEPSKDSLCELFGDSNCRKYPACMRCPLDGHCEWDDEYRKIEGIRES